jgi:hypothetical protein
VEHIDAFGASMDPEGRGLLESVSLARTTSKKKSKERLSAILTALDDYPSLWFEDLGAQIKLKPWIAERRDNGSDYVYAAMSCALPGQQLIMRWCSRKQGVRGDIRSKEREAFEIILIPPWMLYACSCPQINLIGLPATEPVALPTAAKCLLLWRTGIF